MTIEKRHDLDSLAKTLAAAAAKLKKADARNVDQVNAMMADLGRDLLAAAKTLGYYPPYLDQ